MEEVKMGFEPVYDANSRVLILGSFPSVKSREIAFYYGNKQNRFWKTICGFFGEDIPETIDGKKEFLLRNNVALWDMATSCQIEGSADSSVKNATIADLTPILQSAKIQKILLNGTLAYELFIKQYATITIPYIKMPSTSPANPRFRKETWWKELQEVYKNN
ncbi:MAG: DNA-deoxyinosine glycosylase [Clostridiales bacterium]|nr:DNA-deoxyinosine glycosylase [Clostridiales bacterium]